MINEEVAGVLERIADLMEIEGADGFRVNSYRRAARAVGDAADDLAALAEAGKLTSLPGVGKSTAARIQQYLEEGTIDVLEELQAKLPPELPTLLEIPGLGPKKVAVLHAELGVGSVADLKRAIEAGEVAELSGFGAATVKRILEGIDFLERSAGRIPIGVVLPLAEAWLERVRGLAGVARAELAGSLRRGKETIGDVDILCVAKDGEQTVGAFTEFEGVERVLAAGNTKGSVVVGTKGWGDLQIDLRVVAAEAFGAAWQYFTGSKEHNVRLRERAVRGKMSLNEYGLHREEEVVASETEAAVYEALDLPWIAPELREDRGEFDDPKHTESLITEADIRGDLHMHTTASDGHASIAEMAMAARERGYEYIAITDHSKSSTIADGLSIERMRQHIEDIRSANEEVEGIEILVGCECDILPNGKLDYPDDLLAECDWVVASIHAAMGPGGKGKRSPTERTVAAIEHPHIHAIGHPSGRLIGRRPAMELDMSTICAAAAEHDTCLEINAHWSRLDLKDVHIRQARTAGVLLTINTDAHSTDGYDQIHFGLLAARRGGVTPSDVINCLSWKSLSKRLRA
jgi:DNA polymerase (family 10)